jgi:hypothetical protein
MYNSLCPDIELTTINGENHKLSNLIGNVIVIRFSRFIKKDLPYLHYLEHLHRAFKEDGMYLFFVKILGRDYIESHENTFINLAPIVEDDGFISGIFQANLNDLVVIGRDFRIKLKHNQLSNRTIHNQTTKYLHVENSTTHKLSEKEFSTALKRITFKNVQDGKIESLNELITNKPSLINLFISTCFSCPVNNRIQLIKQCVQELNSKHYGFAILFGNGNSLNMTKEFSNNHDLSGVKVGIIQISDKIANEEYIKIFKLDIDPRTVIFSKKGDITFLETVNDNRALNYNFILNKLR